MSSLALAILLVFGFLAGLVAFQIDKAIYCDLPPCGMENVVCLKGNNISLCHPSSRLLSLSSNHRDALLQTVNMFRNTAAAGLTKYLLPAGRMARVEWSGELEHFAKMDAINCFRLQRPCMTSPNFPNMGNIFDTYSYLGKTQDTVKILSNMIYKWTSEAPYVSQKQTVLLTDINHLKSVSRAALLMSERNTHMGCSVVKLKDDHIKYVYVSCAFATMNILGIPIYRTANNTPGEMCQKRDKDFKNLCAVGEKYLENSKLVALKKPLI